MVQKFILPSTMKQYYSNSWITNILTNLGEDFVINFTESYFRKVTRFSGNIVWDITAEASDGREAESEMYSHIIRVPRRKYIDMEFIDTILHECFHKTQEDWCAEDEDEEFLRDCLIEGEAPWLVSKLKAFDIQISDLLYYGSWFEFGAIRFAFDHTMKCVDEMLKEP